ncbi:MAG: hypothetical protein ACYTFG_00340 [Planctomycetota bacterium]|jgi:hypothetical protein
MMFQPFPNVARSHGVSESGGRHGRNYGSSTGGSPGRYHPALTMLDPYRAGRMYGKSQGGFQGRLGPIMRTSGSACGTPKCGLGSRVYCQQSDSGPMPLETS